MTQLAIYRNGDKLVATKLRNPTAGKGLDDFRRDPGLDGREESETELEDFC